MITLSLAIRNLLRNRRRSLATLLAMSLGGAAILLFGGFSGDIKYEMLTKIVQTGGHLQIQHRDFYLYGSGNPTAYGIEDYEQILQAIRTDDVLKEMVVVATPTLQFGGLAGNYAAGVSRTIIGTGYVAENINSMRSWNDYGLRTQAPKSALEGTPPDSAVIGVGLARVLQLCEALGIANCPQPKTTPVDDGAALPDDIAQLSALEAPDAAVAAAGNPRQIEILVANSRGAPNVAAVDVISAEDQGFKELDEIATMMHLAKVQKLVYGNLAPKVTSVMIQLRHTNQMPAAIERLEPIVAKFSRQQPLVLQDYLSLNPFYVQTMQMFDTIFGFVFVLIGAIVLFTVGNTMNTAIVERTVEIGTLRAIGLRRQGIRNLFVTEGALLGVCGSLLGVVLTFVVAGIVNSLDIPWIPPSRVEPVPLIILLSGETRMIIGTTLSLICIAIFSAWLPAYRASNLKVVDALRHV